MEGIIKMPKIETLGKGIVPPSMRNSPFPNFKISCHTSTPLTALQHNGGFKPLTSPLLTKNFKEIKCSLVNCPFLPLYFSLTGHLKKLSYITPF